MSAHTIRLLMPQWQGGDNSNYSFGAELLAWLAPQNDQPLIKVPVYEPDEMGRPNLLGYILTINKFLPCYSKIMSWLPIKIIINRAPTCLYNGRNIISNGNLTVCFVNKLD